MNVTYERKPSMTFIGFFTSIRPEEGYQKCPEFWDVVLRLNRVMADRKMSLNELSEKVGAANVNLSKMKNGHISAIRFSALAAICDVLQCQPGDILEYSPEEKDG